MSGAGNLQGFPQITAPITSPETGYRIGQPWYRLLISLWLRTGASSGGNTSPTGMLMAFASASLPTGWLVCDGTAVSRTIYAALYAIIGTTWGAGDGVSTFNVPNLQNRFLVGAGNFGFATLGGATNFTLSIAQLPSHTHTITDPGHTHTDFAASSTNTAGAAAGAVTTGGMTGSNTTGITINNTGSGSPVNFVPPYAAIVYGIKT
jgi:microcystin-dependent protein